MCELLGLADEGTPNIPTQGHHRRMDEQGNDLELGQDVDGAAIPTNDVVLKRPLIRENLNVIQNTSPRRLMPHLLHQMVQNRTNLGGHSIQMIIIINQATT